MFMKNILVPLDGSMLSERALPYAAELARAADASLTLVRTADVHPRLQLKAYELGTQGLPVDTVDALGEGPRALVAEIERRRPDLVVMSTHGRSGIDRLVHGSVTDTVVSHTGCPVMLVRAPVDGSVSAEPRLSGKHILVPLDGSRFSETALPVAVDLARALSSDILLVQAVLPLYQLPIDLELLRPPTLEQAEWLTDAEDAATAYLNRLAYRLSESERSVRVTGLARIGVLSEVIRELNTPVPAGLVVMSTHGRTGLARSLLGGEADAIVRHDDLPVVLVHPPIAESAPDVDRTLVMSARGER
jgi:nucleotide-binding universal stress UspA family protein